MRSDTTPAAHRELAAIFGDVRSRIVELFIDRPDSCADIPVPTLEGTTVRDVLLHLVDSTSGLVPALHTSSTAHELVKAWGSTVDAVCVSTRPDDVMSRLVADAVMCEQDLRTALGAPGARDDVAVKVALDELAGRFSDRVAAAGLPSLRVTVEQWGTIAGEGPARACVVADRFEFVRAMSGRRSAAEICRWNWSGDPRPYLVVISETALPKDDVRERDPRVPSICVTASSCCDSLGQISNLQAMGALMAPASGLPALRVVSLGSGLPAAYCARLLADSGAEVIRIEDPTGDPLRTWSASGSADGDGALFQFLAGGMTSVVIEDPATLTPALRGADIVLWSPDSTIARALPPERIRHLAPHAVVTAITDFGLTGPWTRRPATELTLQALSGGLAQRGLVDRPPLMAGGRLGDWLAGMFAAVHSLAACHGGGGELLDVSGLESLVLATTMHPVSWHTIAGFPLRPIRSCNLPNVHPTKDGYVGFMVVTGQQWLDFCVLVEHGEWADDPDLGIMIKRVMRRAELVAAVDEWCQSRTTEDVLELADLLRIPAAAVGTGATIPTMDHLVQRNAFVKNPSGGFVQPAIPWRLHGIDQPEPGPAPARGSGALPDWEPVTGVARTGRPFDGLRIADFTANWAGPIVGHVLGLLGAEVIHVEGGKRPDGIRNNTCKPMSDPDWPEFSGLFAGTNTGKRSVTVDMNSEAGQQLARKLIATCDVVLENYSPRVMESWGLGWEQVHAVNPRAVMVRMPAYGLDGPWRDRGGYAQTMEMTSGMAATTGWPDQAPEIPNGPCDPIAGSHATVALLTALRHVRATGEGVLVEAAMLSSALNVAAEAVIEYSAYGVELQRNGNRSPVDVPQGAYPTSEPDRVGLGDTRWVALSVTTDEQWVALCNAMGTPEWRDWMRDVRRVHHDEIDAAISAWTSQSTVDDITATMLDVGVPVGEVVLGHLVPELDQMQHRGFFEHVRHPVTGDNTHAGMPVRWASIPKQVQRGPAPILGGDDDLVWQEQVGLSAQEYRRLRTDGVIGRGQIKGSAW